MSSFVYRESVEADWPFIAGSFAHEYQSTTLLNNEDFKRVVMPLFARQNREARTVVAFPQAEPDEIAGWICWRASALVFGVVKRPYRGLGVWRGLRDLVMGGAEMACMFKPDRFRDPRFRSAPWMALT